MTSRPLRPRIGTLSAVLGLAMGLPGIVQAAPACTLPPLVADRIGRAQIMDSHIPDKSVLRGKRDIVWGSSANDGPGVYMMSYFPNDREFDASLTTDALKTSHPDWIVRKCDGSVPYEFGDARYTPLDISNPNVREHVYGAALAKLKARGAHAFAADNVSPSNVWGRCSMSAQSRYSGVRADPRYTHDVADWMAWSANRAHQDGVCFGANVSFSPSEAQAYAEVTRPIDIVVDEGGFTRNCKPLFLDANWSAKVNALATVARTKALIMIDQVCPSEQGITTAVKQWSIANYMLIKGDRTYLAITPQSPGYTYLYDIPEIYKDIGQPLTGILNQNGARYRQFERALAVVNPSSTESVTFGPIPVGFRREARAAGDARAITLAPGTAVILTGHVPKDQDIQRAEHGWSPHMR